MKYNDETPGNWGDVSVRLKEKWGILTDSDLKMRAGQYDDMLSRLEFILGHSKEHLHRVICGFNESLSVG